jgi:hypothetical protein
MTDAKPIGGILGHHLGPHLTLVDASYRAPALPGTSIYEQEPALPIGKYWYDVFERGDQEEFLRIIEAYAGVSASVPAHAAPAQPASASVSGSESPEPAAQETESAAAPTASTPPSGDDAA